MMHFSSLLVAGLLVAPAHNVGRASEITLSVVQSLSESESAAQCERSICDDDQSVRTARAYFLETSRPGGTMTRQGPELAIGRLHPEFAKRLADAIQAARKAGLEEAGIFSAYRPPVFGVGGFADRLLTEARHS